MPYIDQHSRKVLAHWGSIPNTPGCRNYCITRLILGYCQQQGTPTYQTFNDVLGALEGAKLEFYRRVVIPYEETKCRVNGDVYPPR